MSSPSIFDKTNDSLDNNRAFQNPDIHLTSHGSDWYWAVFAVMTVSAIVFAYMTSRRRRVERLFHHISIAIVAISAIAYYTMASNLGSTSTMVEFERNRSTVVGATRQIFYVRYIQWAFTAPLLLLILLLSAGMNRSNILFTLLLGEIMVIMGLVGALTPSRYKWGYFVFGIAAFLYIAWNIGKTAARKSVRIGTDVGGLYRRGSLYLLIIWSLYPIAWGLSEGGNVIAPDSEAVFYGVLDILTKPVFLAYMLYSHRNVALARLGLDRWENPSVGLDGAGPMHAPMASEAGAPGRVSGATAGTTTSHV